MALIDHERKLQYAWAAGLIDGEGRICLKRQRAGTDKRIVVKMNDLPTLQTLHAIFPVGNRPSERDVPIDGHNQAYYWQFAAVNDLKYVLCRIMPYLVTKVKQAEILFDFVLLTEAIGTLQHDMRQALCAEFGRYDTRGKSIVPEDDESASSILAIAQYLPDAHLLGSAKRQSVPESSVIHPEIFLSQSYRENLRVNAISQARREELTAG